MKNTSLKLFSDQLASRYDPEHTDFSKRKLAQYLCENIVPTDIFVASGSGVVLETNRGRLFDLASMSLNCILGQNDPWVNANLEAYIASGRPSFLSTRVGSEIYYEVAELIAKLSGLENPVVNHRQCNGSDVTELAIVAAYQHRKRGQEKLISFRGSYYGQNLTSFIASDLQKQNRFLINGEPSVYFADAPDNYSFDNPSDLSEHDAGTLKDIRRIAKEAFAVIIEPIQVSNMVNVCSPLFLQQLRQLCDEFEVSLIFDDIQTGFGWLGTFSSVQLFNVRPDLLALSKALTAGYGPLAALVMDQKYKDLPMSTVLKTNGADLRSLVAARSVIERLRGVPTKFIVDGLDEGTQEELRVGMLASFEQKANLLLNHLRQLQKKFPRRVGSIRGYGLIRCIEMLDNGKPDSNACKELQKQLLDNGVLVRDVQHGLLFKIPLVAKENELQDAFNIIDRVLNSSQ